MQTAVISWIATEEHAATRSDLSVEQSTTTGRAATRTQSVAMLRGRVAAFHPSALDVPLLPTAVISWIATKGYAVTRSDASVEGSTTTGLAAIQTQSVLWNRVAAFRPLALVVPLLPTAVIPWIATGGYAATRSDLSVEGSTTTGRAATRTQSVVATLAVFRSYARARRTPSAALGCAPAGRARESLSPDDWTMLAAGWQ